jgi:hypothetical protein
VEVKGVREAGVGDFNGIAGINNNGSVLLGEVNVMKGKRGMDQIEISFQFMAKPGFIQLLGLLDHGLKGLLYLIVFHVNRGIFNDEINKKDYQ